MQAAATYSLAVQSCSRQAGCAAGGLLSGLYAQGRGLPKGGGGARGQLPPHQQQDQAHEPGVSPPLQPAFLVLPAPMPGARPADLA